MDTLENVMKMDNIKTRHVMLKQVQDKNGPAIVFAPKNCSPGYKWKNPVLVASIRSLKTPSPSLSRGLLPRVCVMRMATLKVCHTSFWLIWDSINPSVRCARKSLGECHFWKVSRFFLKGTFWIPNLHCAGSPNRSVCALKSCKEHSQWNCSYILHLAWQTKHLKN